MDSYSNKINRIKYTIDEIRDDIEKTKMVIQYISILLTYRKTKKQLIQ